jgi:hypothetical protein
VCPHRVRAALSMVQGGCDPVCFTMLCSGTYFTSADQSRRQQAVAPRNLRRTWTSAASTVSGPWSYGEAAPRAPTRAQDHSSPQGRLHVLHDTRVSAAAWRATERIRPCTIRTWLRVFRLCRYIPPQAWILLLVLIAVSTLVRLVAIVS